VNITPTPNFNFVMMPATLDVAKPQRMHTQALLQHMAALQEAQGLEF
jgi:hypothetical protein